MSVNPLHFQSILVHNGRDGSIGNEFVPDAKGGGWTSYICFGKARGGGRKSTGSYAWVNTYADFLVGVGKGLADAF
jgi:hypothetical protein